MDKQLIKLESILNRQLSAHDQLLALLKQKHDALRAADHQRITQCCAQENDLVQAISDLEKQRLTVIGELTALIAPTNEDPLRLVDLAQRIEEPARGRLLVLRQQLKERMTQSSKETATARRATELLVRHMQGLIQTIGNIMTGVGAYSHKGAPPKGAMAINTFNAMA